VKLFDPKVFPNAAFFCGDSIEMSCASLVPFRFVNGFGALEGPPKVNELDEGGWKLKELLFPADD
jgi:hypothetical protein